MGKKKIFSSSLALLVFLAVIEIPSSSAMECYKCAFPHNINCGLTIFNNRSISTTSRCMYGCETVATFTEGGSMASSVIRRCAGQFTKTECIVGPRNMQAVCKYLCTSNNCNGAVPAPEPSTATQCYSCSSSTSLNCLNKMSLTTAAIISCPEGCVTVAEYGAKGGLLSVSRGCAISSNSTTNCHRDPKNKHQEICTAPCTADYCNSNAVEQSIPGTSSAECFSCSSLTNPYCTLTDFNTTMIKTITCPYGVCGSISFINKLNSNEPAMVTRGCSASLNKMSSSCSPLKQRGAWEACVSTCNSSLCNSESISTPATSTTPQISTVSFQTQTNPGQTTSSQASVSTVSPSASTTPTQSAPSTSGDAPITVNGVTSITNGAPSTTNGATSTTISSTSTTNGATSTTNGASSTEFSPPTQGVSSSNGMSTFTPVSIPLPSVQCYQCSDCYTAPQLSEDMTMCNSGVCLTIIGTNTSDSEDVDFISRGCFTPGTYSECYTNEGIQYCPQTCSQNFCNNDAFATPPTTPGLPPDSTAEPVTPKITSSIQCYQCSGYEDVSCAMGSFSSSDIITCTSGACVTVVGTFGAASGNITTISRGCYVMGMYSGCNLENSIEYCPTFCTDTLCNGETFYLSDGSLPVDGSTPSNPQGSSIPTNPQGSSIPTNPQGSSTPTNPQSSSIPTNPQGYSNPTSGPSSTSTMSGSSTTINQESSTPVNFQGASTTVNQGSTTTSPETITTTIPASSTTINPQGSSPVSNPQGSSTTMNPQSSSATASTQGSATTTSPGATTTAISGSSPTVNQQGFSTTMNPQSTSTSEISQGSSIGPSTQGSSKTINPLGFSNGTNPQGSPTTANFQGSATFSNPQGSTTVNPGSTATTGQGSSSASNTQGSTTAPISGAIITTISGSSVLSNPSTTPGYLQCYSCTGSEDSDCGDENFDGAELDIVDCPVGNYWSCAVVQTWYYDYPGPPSGYSISRGCFQNGMQLTCTDGGGAEICTYACNTNLCNGEPSIPSNSTTLPPASTPSPSPVSPTPVLCYQCSGDASTCGPESPNLQNLPVETCDSGACMTSQTIEIIDNENVISMTRGCYTPGVNAGCVVWGDMENCSTVCITNYCNGEAPLPSGSPVTSQSSSDGSLASGASTTPTVQPSPTTGFSFSFSEGTGHSFSFSDFSGFSPYFTSPLPSVSCYQCSGSAYSDCNVSPLNNQYLTTCNSGSCLIITGVNSTNYADMEVVSRGCYTPGIYYYCYDSDGVTYCPQSCSSNNCNDEIFAAPATPPPPTGVTPQEGSTPEPVTGPVNVPGVLCMQCHGTSLSSCNYGPFSTSDQIMCSSGACITIVTELEGTTDIITVSRGCYITGMYSSCYSNNGVEYCPFICDNYLCNGDIVPVHASTIYPPSGTNPSGETGTGFSRTPGFSFDHSFGSTFQFIPSPPSVECYQCTNCYNAPSQNSQDVLTCNSGFCLTITGTNTSDSEDMELVSRGCYTPGIFDGCYTDEGIQYCAQTCSNNLCNNEIFAAPQSATNIPPIEGSTQQPGTPASSVSPVSPVTVPSIECFVCFGYSTLSECSRGLLDSTITCASGYCLTVIGKIQGIDATVSRGCYVTGMYQGCYVDNGLQYCPLLCEGNLCNSDTFSPSIPSVESTFPTGSTTPKGPPSFPTDFQSSSYPTGPQGSSFPTIPQGSSFPTDSHSSSFPTGSYGTEFSLPSTSPLTSVQCYQCSGSAYSDCNVSPLSSLYLITCNSGSCLTITGVNTTNYADMEIVSRGCYTPGIYYECYNSDGVTYCPQSCSSNNCNDEIFAAPATTPPPTGMTSPAGSTSEPVTGPVSVTGVICVQCQGTSLSSCAYGPFSYGDQIMCTSGACITVVTELEGKNDIITVSRGCYITGMYSGCYTDKGREYCPFICDSYMCNGDIVPVHASTLYPDGGTNPTGETGTGISHTPGFSFGDHSFGSTFPFTMTPSPPSVTCYQCTNCLTTPQNDQDALTCNSGFCLTITGTNTSDSEDIELVSRGCYTPGIYDGCYTDEGIQYCAQTCSNNLCNNEIFASPQSSTDVPPLEGSTQQQGTPVTPVAESGISCFECFGYTTLSECSRGLIDYTVTCPSGYCLTVIGKIQDTDIDATVSRGCYVTGMYQGCYVENGLQYCPLLCQGNLCNSDTFSPSVPSVESTFPTGSTTPQGSPSFTTDFQSSSFPTDFQSPSYPTNFQSFSFPTGEMTTPAPPVVCYICSGDDSTGCGIRDYTYGGLEYCYTGACLLSATYTKGETMAQVTRSCGSIGKTTGCTYGTDGSMTCTDICTSDYCNLEIPEYPVYCYECNSLSSDCASNSFGVPGRTCEYGSCLTITVTDQATGNLTDIQRTCGMFHVNKSACYQENGTNICIDQCTNDFCNLERQPVVANTTVQPFVCYLCSGSKNSACGYTTLESYEYSICSTGACQTSVTYYNQTTMEVSRSCAPPGQYSECSYWGNGFITCNSICNDSYNCNGVPPYIPITCYECNSNSSASCASPSSGLPIASCDVGTCLTMTTTDAATGSITQVVRTCGISDRAESVTHQQNGQIISITQCSESYCNYQSGSTNSTLQPSDGTLCYTCSSDIKSDDCGITTFYDGVDEMCFTGSCVMSVSFSYNVTQSTISRTCATPGQQSGCTTGADGSVTCSNVCSQQYCNGQPPIIQLECYSCSSYSGTSCDAVNYGLPTEYCSYGSCLAVTVTDQATGNLTLVERSCGYYATHFSGCSVQNGQQICVSQCTENFCNLDIPPGEILPTFQPYNTECYICSGNENTGCGISSMYAYALDMCFSGACIISATYSANETTPQVRRSCASPGQQSGCTYNTNGLLTCTTVCSENYCNANVAEMTEYCYECNSEVNTGCYTMGSGVTGEICYYGSCLTITVTDEASGNITKVQRGCGGFDYPESGCYEQNGQKVCLTQCQGFYCNSEIFQVQAGATTTQIPTTVRQPVGCYICSGVENTGCGITSMYDYTTTSCSLGSCTTSITFNYNQTQTVTQVSRYCSTPGQTSGCSLGTDGTVTCSHVCYESYCDGTTEFNPVFCYACNSDTDPGCYTLSSVNYEYCMYGSCLTITSTDEATGVVTHIERGCGVFAVYAQECQEENGQNICVTQCTEDYCNDIKELTPMPSATPPSYSMSLPCYQCNGSLDSACGLANFNNRLVNEITCYDQYCATIVTVDYGSYPYSVVSVSRGCSSNINSSCSTESNTETCTKICSTGLCNGEPTAPPGFHCYLCSGTEESACGDGTFNPVKVSIATCPTAACAIMTVTDQNDASLPPTIMRGCSAPVMSEGCENKNGYQYCYQNCYNNLCNAGTASSNATTSIMPAAPVQCYSCQANANSDCGKANTDSSLVTEVTCNSGLCITTVTTYFYFTYSVTDYTRGCFEPGQVDGCYSPADDIHTCNYPCNSDLCNTKPVSNPAGLQCYHCSGADDSICGISTFNSQAVSIETCSTSACGVMTVSNANDPSDITSVIRGCYKENTTLGCVTRNGLEYCYSTCDTNLCNSGITALNFTTGTIRMKTTTTTTTTTTNTNLATTTPTSVQCYTCTGSYDSYCGTGDAVLGQFSQETCTSGSCMISVNSYYDGTKLTDQQVTRSCAEQGNINGCDSQGDNLMCSSLCSTELCNTNPYTVVGTQCYFCEGTVGTPCGPTTFNPAGITVTICPAGCATLTITNQDTQSEFASVTRGCYSENSTLGCENINGYEYCYSNCSPNLCNTGTVSMTALATNSTTTTISTPSIATVTAPSAVGTMQCYECSGAQNSDCWTGNTDSSQTSQVNCDSGSCAITTTTYNDGNSTISRGCGTGTSVLSNSCTTINVNGASTQSCVTQCITNLCNDQQNDLVSSSDVAGRMRTTWAQIYVCIVVLAVTKILL